MPNVYPKIYLYKRIVQAKLFIDSHYHQAIDLHNIADEAFFSKFHFIRLFRHLYGMTPHQYLIRTRVEHARLLLEHGLTVTDTCYAVGFESCSSFAALFKKTLSLSPSAYQLAYKKRQQQIKETPLRFVPNCFANQKGWAEKSNFQEVR